jgi:hypothetical protein
VYLLDIKILKINRTFIRIAIIVIMSQFEIQFFKYKKTFCDFIFKVIKNRRRFKCITIYFGLILPDVQTYI